MSELKPAPDAQFSSPAQTKRLVAELDLQWFGTSRYSDVGKGRLHGHLVTVKRFRTHEGCGFSEQQLGRVSEDWKRVASHPNIQVCLGLLGPNLLSPFRLLVTSYMAGDILNYTQTNPQADKEMLIYDVASAITHMHGQVPSVTQGNIKASNILVDEGHVYVSNIGIREALSTLQKPGYELRWAAPEKVLEDQPHDMQCDNGIYTGQRPFQHYPVGANVVLAMREGKVPS